MANEYPNNGVQYEPPSSEVNIDIIAAQTLYMFEKFETFLQAYEEWKQGGGLKLIKTVIKDIPTIQALANSLPQVYPEYGDFNVTYEYDSEDLGPSDIDYPVY
ncbi:unnamed protein product [Trichobilharzia szidati]|nr:unnamed protein product [Trichobilharzia szidati]